MECPGKLYNKDTQCDLNEITSMKYLDENGRFISSIYPPGLSCSCKSIYLLFIFEMCHDILAAVTRVRSLSSVKTILHFDISSYLSVYIFCVCVYLSVYLSACLPVSVLYVFLSGSLSVLLLVSFVLRYSHPPTFVSSAACFS